MDPVSLTSPCLLSNTDAKPRELRVVSERYYPVSLRISDPPSEKTFYVKRRSAHLSYRQDPDSQRSLLVQTGSFLSGGSLDLIASFTDDEKVLAFARHLCDVGGSFECTKNHGPFSVAGFCSRVLHECLLLDTQEALPLYLAIRSAIVSVQAGLRCSVPFIWDFRLIRSYYEQRRRLVADESPRLLNSELVAYLNELLENELGVAIENDSFPLDGSVSTYFGVPINVTSAGDYVAADSDSMDLS